MFRQCESVQIMFEDFRKARQFAIALAFVVVAAFVPTLLRWGWAIFFELTSGQLNSLLAAAGASSIAMWMTLNTKINFFTSPYIVSAIYNVFAFIIAYLFMFFLRNDFSIYIITSAFLVSLLGCAIVTRESAFTRRKFFVVPFGKCDLKEDGLTKSWTFLIEPAFPSEKNFAIVADLQSALPDEWQRFLSKCVINNYSVIDYESAQEIATHQVKIENLYEHFVHSLNPSPVYFVLKSLFDKVGAILAIVIAAPLIGLICLLIKFSSDGPVFYHQIRVGYRGKPFVMHKFRTMYHREDVGWEGPTNQSDHRITPIGRHLRRHRLDELPQLLNVIKGQMSLIGPRPEAVPLAREYSKKIPFFEFRYVVKPGITGWAQVEQGFAADIDNMYKKLRYDFFYIKYFSFTMDVSIIIRTIFVVLFGKGYR